MSKYAMGFPPAPASARLRDRSPPRLWRSGVGVVNTQP